MGSGEDPPLPPPQNLICILGWHRILIKARQEERGTRVSKRAAPRPPPNVVISSALPLTNAPYGQNGMEVNPFFFLLLQGCTRKRPSHVVRDDNSSQNSSPCTCATLYTGREQWTDLSAPKSTRCAPSPRRGRTLLLRRLLFSKLKKIECRRLKQFTSTFRTHVPSSLPSSSFHSLVELTPSI